MLLLPTAAEITQAAKSLPRKLVQKTRLHRHETLSEQYEANVILALENEQTIRSYKIRGACWALMRQLEAGNGHHVVCASAGNHAQGVAAACNTLGVKGVIFMPETTTTQKIDATTRHGNGSIEIQLVGTYFDNAYAAARSYSERQGATFIHPFDDRDVITGQGTLAKDIVDGMEERREEMDMLIGPVGGGGLMSGVAIYMRQEKPETQLRGIEPLGAAAMKASLEAGHIITLESINPIVDGAAVRTPGKLTFDAFRENRIPVQTVPEGRLCKTVHDLFNINGIVCELAGGLSVDALQDLGAEIRGKTVVCIVSGGNISTAKLSEVAGEAERYQMRLCDISIELPNKPGALHELTGLLHRQCPHVSLESVHYDARESTDAEVQLTLQSVVSGEVQKALSVLRLGGYSFETRKK